MLWWNAGCCDNGSFMFYVEFQENQDQTARLQVRFMFFNPLDIRWPLAGKDRDDESDFKNLLDGLYKFLQHSTAFFPIIDNCLLLFCWGAGLLSKHTASGFGQGRGVRFKPVELSTKKGLRGR